jgi:hypothetical protein
MDPIMLSMPCTPEKVRAKEDKNRQKCNAINPNHAMKWQMDNLLPMVRKDKVETWVNFISNVAALPF